MDQARLTDFFAKVDKATDRILAVPPKLQIEVDFKKPAQVEAKLDEALGLWWQRAHPEFNGMALYRWEWEHESEEFFARPADMKAFAERFGSVEACVSGTCWICYEDREENFDEDGNCGCKSNMQFSEVKFKVVTQPHELAIAFKNNPELSCRSKVLRRFMHQLNFDSREFFNVWKYLPEEEENDDGLTISSDIRNWSSETEKTKSAAADSDSDGDVEM